MADNKGTITHRVAAFHTLDEADTFARESAALYGVEPGELYVTETWNGFRVPSIKLIRQNLPGVCHVHSKCAILDLRS